VQAGKELKPLFTFPNNLSCHLSWRKAGEFPNQQNAKDATEAASLFHC
jgi:hypothetical protein